MATASERMSEIDASTLKTWMDSGEVFLVDVCDPAEEAEERIPGTDLGPCQVSALSKPPSRKEEKLCCIAAPANARPWRGSSS